jgi:capreomycidine synthase
MATHGSSEAIFLILNTLLRPGDEIVVLDPLYHALHLVAEAIGCQLKIWRLPFTDGSGPDLAQAKSLISSRTRMVIVNFPHNPTGVTLTPEQQTDLIDAVAEVGAYLLWDNAFAELTYDRPPLPDPTLQYSRAISLGTLSKAYGLPGLRVGWCLASPDILARCVQLRDYITLALSPLIELIAQRAIEQAGRLLDSRLRQARRNREIVMEWVERHPTFVEGICPQGGVTSFLRLPRIPDVDAFCDHLASAYGTLLVPGSCFNHPDHIRLGFGGPTAELQEGLARLSHALRQGSLERL